jgi:uncharacterized protein (DUF302 family)
MALRSAHRATGSSAVGRPANCRVRGGDAHGKLFAVIDQAAKARQAGLTLRETTLVLFGSPKAGTPVMAASPLAALDLPLKVLIRADGDQTKVSYYASAALATSHHLAADLAGIDTLTDALVAS